MDLLFAKNLKFLYLFLFLFNVCDSVRVRGKFDRFGKSKNLHLGYFRTMDSMNYYQNPDGAKITKSSHFESEYELGRKVLFFCTAEGTPIPHITWFKDEVEMFDHSWLQIHEWIDEKKMKLKSKLEIDPATQMDRGEYECVANNKWAIDRRRFRTDYIEME